MDDIGNNYIPKGFLLSKDGKLWIPADQFYEDAWDAAIDLRSLREEKQFKHFYCLARGGYPFGAVVGNCFNTNDIPSLVINSYSDDRQGTVKIVSDIPIELLESKGKGLLLVDDLFDTGSTAREIKKVLPEAFLAAVYAKPTGESIADYFFKSVPNMWVVFPWEARPRDFVPA